MLLYGGTYLEKSYTVDDIYALPDGKRAELIDGNLYMMAPPNTKHQLIMNDINIAIYNYIKSKGGKCKVIPAPFAVFLENADGNTNYVEPDISVICDPDKLNDKGCNGAPDWIIEIVSPSSRKMDYITKTNLYMNAGVKEYWIVDPMREIVMVYKASEDAVPVFSRFGEKIKVGIYDDLEIIVE